MTSITYAASDSYPVAILIKASSFNKQAIDSSYLVPLVKKGLDKGDVIAYALPYNEVGKAPKKHIIQVLDDLLSDLLDNGVKYIYCADAAFFKVLSGLTKADPNLGYCLPCKYAGYQRFELVLGVNHTSLMYNPLNENKLNLSLKALTSALLDETPHFDGSILKNARFPQSTLEVDQALKDLLDYPVLAVDIETFHLDHDKAGIGTIAFAWNDSEGVSFAVDYESVTPENGVYGKQVHHPERKKLLRKFFDAYTGQMSFHRANFDIKILIYELYMDTLDDTEGLLTGLEVFTRDFDDTRIISYLALNSCAGNELSLKVLAQPYAGNYAQDEISDITRIPYVTLLDYNLIDACCTNWVHDQYYSRLQADDQEGIYFDIMLPSLKTIIQMELTGMPLNPKRVQEVRHELEIIRTRNEVVIRKHPMITQAEQVITRREYEKDFADRVAKAKHPEKIKEKDFATFPKKRFNSNSSKQLQVLLYELLQLPVIEKTKTGQPATGADVLEKLENHVKDQSTRELFKALIGFAQADKILTTFITAFERAISHNPDDPRVYIHGSFNLGGTISARLSSSDPNLQNIPSNSIHGKLIKSCFQANNKELFVGADFNSLEAMVNALTTKDPNKLTVYENGLDSHSWNAFGYWPEKMPDVKDMMDRSDLPGKFFRIDHPDGQHTYLHESEL